MDFGLLALGVALIALALGVYSAWPRERAEDVYARLLPYLTFTLTHHYSLLKRGLIDTDKMRQIVTAVLERDYDTLDGLFGDIVSMVKEQQP